LKRSKGLTLIELLVAMAISAILTAGLYRTFIGQHKTYAVQEQVVDMQQNVRVAINRMMREIRMAGFGSVWNVFPPEHLPFLTLGGPFLDVINPGNSLDIIDGQPVDQITIIGAFEQVSTLSQSTDGSDTIELAGGADEFNILLKRYLCIGGLETHIVRWKNGNTITLDSNLLFNHAAGTPVFKVKAIRYRLRWDNNNPRMPVLTREDLTNGGGSQVVAENIDNLQFRYVLEDESESDSPADPSKIRMVRVTVYARTSFSDLEFKSDPQFKVGVGGFRRRTIASNILVRNMGSGP
jgi:prepilin-type N-terminal cleavage/methylation domain-containing protein